MAKQNEFLASVLANLKKKYDERAQLPVPGCANVYAGLTTDQLKMLIKRAITEGYGE